MTRATPRAADTSKPKLSCRNLWKVFGTGADEFMRQRNGDASSADLGQANLLGAVRRASIDVNEGEIFIVMGLSGSGKSTLVRCLSRLIEPTYGDIVFDGRDLLKASEAELIEIRRHKMGMVFQHFALLPHLTVIENVAFPLAVQGVDKQKRLKRAREMIDLVSLGGRENHYPRELSGGQQQRVGIARSLAVEPDVWFLDEPFSALDPLIRREMQDEFLRLQKLLKKTIIFITHDFEEAVRLGDRIGIMKDGELVQLATAEEMVTSPANDYVRAFTRNAPRERIVTIASLVDKSISASASPVIPSTTKIGDAAAQVLASDTPVGVVDEAGHMLGAVTRQQMIAAIFTGQRA